MDKRMKTMVFKYELRSILKILSLFENKNERSKEDLFTSISWFDRRISTFLSYCKYARLLSYDPKKRTYIISPLGKILLVLNKRNYSAFRELAYYALASSKDFYTLSLFVGYLFETIERSGPFEITREHEGRFIEKYASHQKSSHYIGNLMNTLLECGITKRTKRNKKYYYQIDYYRPTLEGFALSFFDYVNQKFKMERARYGTKEVTDLRKFFFMKSGYFDEYIMKCHNKRWLHREKFATIDQFYFFTDNLVAFANEVLE